jgi:nucleoside-diphosphate-sugar epimerase
VKVLLTGASGFIGRHVLADLRQQGIETVAVGRTRPEYYEGDFITADLLRSEAPALVIDRARPTHLIHLAWYTEHGAYWTSPLNLRWLDASVRLTEAFCAAGGKKLIAAGTCAEYDWTIGYCREDSSPLAPTTLYGTAKDATRRLLAALCAAADVEFAWGRVFMPYGEGEDERRLIPSLTAVFEGRRDPFGVNGATYRDFLQVKDVARAFTCLLRPEARGDYNIASGQPTRIADVVLRIAEALGGDARRVLDLPPSRLGEPEILLGDNQKLRSLGWTFGNPMEGVLDFIQ